MTRRFRIPIDNHRPLFGVFLAAHAIPDAVDIIHTGVGCKPKAQRQISSHDRMREAQNKMVWSDVDESLLIKGSGGRLRDMTVETVRRRHGVGLVLVTTSTAMEMTSPDVEAVVEEIRARIDCPIVYVPTPGWGGDLHDGYQRACLAVLGLCDWSSPPQSRPAANIVGYLFDRYEMDHAANLGELGRLLSGLGVDLVSTFLSGVPVASLRNAPRAGANIVLPWAVSIAGRVPAVTGRPSRLVSLPLGVGATTSFLGQVADLLRLPGDALERLVAAEMHRLDPLLRIARERLGGSRIAIVADTPVAAALAGLASELGATVALVGLADRTLGGRSAFDSALSRSGHGIAAGCPVLENPSTQDLVEALDAVGFPGAGAGTGHGAGAHAGPPAILVAPDLWLPPRLASSIARVELGIPSNRRHVIHPAPFLGYRGAISLAQRLMDSLLP